MLWALAGVGAKGIGMMASKAVWAAVAVAAMVAAVAWSSAMGQPASGPGTSATAAPAVGATTRPAGGAASVPASIPASRPARPVEGGRPRNWSNQPPWAQEPGGPRHNTFRSELVKQDVGYTIWLPPAYEARPEGRFPVVYSLHGITGDEVDGARRFARILQGAIEAGQCPPTILVMVNGYRDSFYVDSVDKTVPMESIIITELIPHVDATYRTVADRKGRGIAGFSMGGYGAMRLGLKYTDVFSSIVSMGGAFVGEDTGRSRGGAAFGGNMEYFRACDPANIARANAGKIRAARMEILMACGDQDGLMGRNRQMSALLTELGIVHRFVSVPGVGHDHSAMYNGLGAAAWETHGRGSGWAPARSASQPASVPVSAPASAPGR